MRMMDDTNGSVKEAMIFYTPATSLAAGEIIAAFPETKIYLPYGYTLEKLKEKLINMTDNPNFSGISRMENIAKLFQISKEFPGIADIFNSHEGSVRAELSKLKGIKHLSEIARELSGMYNYFRKDEQFRNFVYLWLELFNAKNSKFKSSYKDIESLKKRYGDRLDIFPANDIIGNFARDKTIAAQDSGRKILIQGMPDDAGALNYGSISDKGETKIAENHFWNGKYDVVPYSDVYLETYEGGDLRPAGETLFVGQDTWVGNRRAGYDEQEIIEELQRISGREKVVVIGKGVKPLFLTHLDMYFMPFDEESVAVGDITPVVKFLKSTEKLSSIHERSFESKQTYLNIVSKKLKEMGFEVERIPLYLEYKNSGYDERSVAMTLRSFANNVRNGNTAVLFPFGVPELDEPGYEIFERHGLVVKALTLGGSLYEIMERGSYGSIFESGGVRCLFNVLAQS